MDKEHFLAPVEVVEQRIAAPMERRLRDRCKSGAQHPCQHPPPEDLRTAQRCQLRENPCRKEYGHIRRDRAEQAIQGQNREMLRRYTMQLPDGAQVHSGSTAQRCFFLHIQNALPS